jgi:hypothetical protein
MGMQSLKMTLRPTLQDPYRVLPTVGFPALQFNTSKKQFVAFGNVPKAEFWFIEMPARYRSFDPAIDVRQIVGGVPQSSPSFYRDWIILPASIEKSGTGLLRLRSIGCLSCKSAPGKDRHNDPA